MIESARVVIITNIPTPYRIPVFDRLSQNDFLVIYCARTEKNRGWDAVNLKHRHYFLGATPRSNSDGYNFSYDYSGVGALLARFSPEVVVSCGFNPVHLRAFLWCKMRGVAHLCMTDGTLKSESSLSVRHRLARRLVFRGSRGFIAASNGGSDLYRSYGIDPSRIFRSPLCADNERFSSCRRALAERDIDVLFVGQLHERKLPLFFAAVCKSIATLLGRRLRVAVLGSGPLESKTRSALCVDQVALESPGFVQPTDLPHWFGRSKVLLFPTLRDPWGVVANEAMAAGTPVITTECAGVAGELVLHQENGFVLPVDVEQWARTVVRLLKDEFEWLRFSENATKAVAAYTFDIAAQGIVSACALAVPQLEGVEHRNHE